MRSLLFAEGIAPGSVVLVTGATSGIGEAVALRLARGGYHLVLAARTEEKVAAIAERCRQEGAASCLAVPTDVSDDAAVAALVERTREEHGRLDGVAHCAGEVTYGRTEDTSAEVFDRVVSTNLAGAANVARHALPLLRERDHAVLLIVGSLLGQVAVPEMTPYVVSKWAVRALARQLQVENVGHAGLRVVHVSPGSVDTPIYDRALDSAGAVNRPPPPTISPERVARTIVRELERPLRGSLTRETAWSNHLLTAGFRAVPWAYDRVIGPVFKAASRKKDEAA
jgi:NAD(P)-dependent dehydrogenase (short-subunit alcohol dehydrogenase family)